MRITQELGRVSRRYPNCGIRIEMGLLQWRAGDKVEFGWANNDATD
jgi:hypothetical protein